MSSAVHLHVEEMSVQVMAGPVALEGNLALPDEPAGIVLFAHGSGSSRHSPRNRHVARVLNEAGLATLLFDLLTRDEEEMDAVTTHLRFDIPLLAERLVGATDWLDAVPTIRGLPLGYFGASTGAGAALAAAARRSEKVGAVVSRGGRPDLAGALLEEVQAPTLLIVGGKDFAVIGLNSDALNTLGSADKQLVIVPEATHLFEEPGALEEVARLAAGWFTRFLGGHRAGP
jgi:putative phosphoribosyl transferase